MVYILEGGPHGLKGIQEGYSCAISSMNLKQNGGFFNWIDEDMTKWQRNVINKLVLEKKSVEAQLDAAHNEVKELESQRSLLLYENDTLKLKYKAISAERKMKRGSIINRGGVSI
ncbi:Serine--tRNA ligase [Bienertia sinuspersici]